MAPGLDTPRQQRIWLDLGRVQVAKAGDDSAPWIIYITASTPSLDHEGERVLPQALAEASEYFLKRGQVTFEHVSGEARYDPSILIGRPIAMHVTSDGKTLVQAELYKHQPKAAQVWNILRSGGTLGASIGGLVMQRSQTPDGTPTLDRLLWTHLAITSWPVNEDTTVDLEPYGAFLAKALGVSGGAPLVMEDLEGARLKGLPALRVTWQALTAIVHQTLGVSWADAKRLALLTLLQRGDTRQAYVSSTQRPSRG